MKKLTVLFMLIATIAKAQDSNISTFSISWPDQSISKITLKEYLDSEGDIEYYSLQSDDDIEFNGKMNENSQMLLNPNHTSTCEMDNALFFSASQELFLNIERYSTGEACDYYLDAMNQGYLNFRKASDTTIVGKITLDGVHFTKCVNEVPGQGCLLSKHIPIVIFEEYSFNNGQSVLIDIVTSLYSKIPLQINTSPNPAGTFIKISGFEHSEITFSIQDIHGNKVLNGTSNDGTILIESLLPGLYFLKIGEYHTTRFIKQ